MVASHSVESHELNHKTRGENDNLPGIAIVNPVRGYKFRSSAVPIIITDRKLCRDLA